MTNRLKLEPRKQMSRALKQGVIEY